MPNLPAILLELPLQRTPVTDALMLLGLGLIGLVVVLHLRRYQREAGGAAGGNGASGGTRLTPREEIERQRQERALRGQLEDVLTGLEQAADKMGRDLDAKAARLEKLIAEADGRIARLEELQARATARREAPGELPAEATTEEPEPAAKLPPRRDEPPPRAAKAPSPPLPPMPAEDPVDPVTRCVYELADKGLEPMEIARQLDQHVGKVELILALREV